MLTFNSNGIEVPETSDIIQIFEGMFRDIFGTSVNLNPSSLNGLFIQELTNQAVSSMTDSLSLFNNYSLVTANGIFLDYIGVNFNVFRRQGSYSQIQIQMNGKAGTIIPTSTEVSDGTHTFLSIQSYVIGDTGFIIGEYQAKELGNFIPNVNSVTNLISFVPGLDSVTNVGTGDKPGSLAETDADYRARIPLEVFDTQRGTFRSLEAALSKVSRDFVIIENFTDKEVTESGVDISPHSLWISSNDGSNEDIANAIYDYKSIGCGLVGDQVYTINGYEIKFNRPTLVPVAFAVEVVTTPNQPPDLINLIKTTILEFTKTTSKIGQTLFSSEFIAELDRVGVIFIESLKINNVSSVDSTITQLLTTTIDKIEVTVLET